MKRAMAALVAALVVVTLATGTAFGAPKCRSFGSATVTEGPEGTFTIVSDGEDPTWGGPE